MNGGGPSTVHVVHCVDTEGPLYEPLEATFERLRHLFGVALEPTRENLERVQRGEVDLGGREQEAAAAFNANFLNYNDTWDKVDAMLSAVMSPAYREALTDSFGGGWVFNWHCVDHVGYDMNVRRRDIGYHNIFDHYARRIHETGSWRDGLHFHYHPKPLSRQAHHNATHWFAHDDALFQSVARRLIDRLWFPCVNRAGFHVLRPDSHWFLEQHIPFDFSNQAREDALLGQADLVDGRFGDWRRAPATWTPYHPAHDDYQSEGACRRWIARCLNIGTRHSFLRQEDVDQAFDEAAAGRPAVLAFTNHDFREIRPDIAAVRAMLAKAAARRPDTPFRFCEAREAMRSALGLNPQPFSLDLTLTGGRLDIVAAEAPTFGPQPFLAIRTADGRYFHDNLIIHQPFRRWSYIFDEQSLPLRAVDRIGIGACGPTGEVTAATLEPATGIVRRGGDAAAKVGR